MAITPRFTDQTEQAILQRILDAIVPEVDKRQGSIAYDLTDPVAQELAQAYINLDIALSYAFLNDEMPSELLTKVASSFGVDRKPSIKAVGVVNLSGPVAQVIPQGTQVRTDDGVYFTTQSNVTLSATGVGSATVIATLGGTSGNVRVGDINTIVGDLAGVVTVTNPIAFDTGVDEESDEALLARTYDKLRNPATSGNPAHYVQWAKEVAGVGDAKCIPTWNGPGTVKVVLLADDKQAPNPSVIDAVATHINANRPIGPTITVVGVSEKAINITANLTLADGTTLAEVKAEFESAVATYLESLAFTDNIVRYTQIAALLLGVPRILDYANLTINGGTANIQTTAEEVAILGTVTLNV